MIYSNYAKLLPFLFTIAIGIIWKFSGISDKVNSTLDPQTQISQNSNQDSKSPPDESDQNLGGLNRTFFFPDRKFNITNEVEMKAYINKVKSYLKDHSNTQLAIVGHTNTSESENANIKRAKYMVSKMTRLFRNGGIIRNRIYTTALGSSMPKVDFYSAGADSLNNRVELYIKVVEEAIAVADFKRMSTNVDSCRSAGGIVIDPMEFSKTFLFSEIEAKFFEDDEMKNYVNKLKCYLQNNPNNRLAVVGYIKDVEGKHAKLNHAQMMVWKVIRFFRERQISSLRIFTDVEIVSAPISEPDSSAVLRINNRVELSIRVDEEAIAVVDFKRMSTNRNSSTQQVDSCRSAGGTVTDPMELRKTILFSKIEAKNIEDDEMKNYISKLKCYLQDHPNNKLAIVGYINDAGDNFANLKHAQMMVAKVRRFFRDNKIGRHSFFTDVEIVSAPKREPNSSAALRINNRVDIFIKESIDR